jgi:transposase
MERFIGLDAHTQSCTFGVIDARGKQLRTDVVETNGEALVEYVRLIAGQRHLCLEEGTQSQWLSEILSPHVHELVVIWAEKKRGNKNDTLDAFGLAERIRTGSLGRRTFKAAASFTELRTVARVYELITRDVVRTKNRIHSAYRSRGVAVTGRQAIYAPATRQQFLDQLPSQTRGAVDMLCRELDGQETVKAEAQKALLAEARQHEPFKIIKTVPGMGPVRAAQAVAIIVTPYRFRTSRQLWAYCGLAIVMRSSSDWVQQPDGGWMRSPVTQTRGLNRNFNRTAKAIFKGAATTAVTQLCKSPLYADYERLLAGGTKPNLAKLTIARKVAAMTWSMWKNKERYDPRRNRKPAA